MDTTLNTYNVTFVLDDLTMTTTIMAMNEDVAPEIAHEQLAYDYPQVAALVDQAWDISVELLDTNVLGEAV